MCCIRNRTLKLAARVLHQKLDTPTFCSTRAASEIGHSNSEIGHSNFLQLGSNFFAAHVLHQNIQDSNMAMIYLADGAPLPTSDIIILCLTTKLRGTGDRFGDHLCVHCDNLPCASGHNQFKNTTFTRPIPKISRSTYDRLTDSDCLVVLSGTYWELT